MKSKRTGWRGRLLRIVLSAAMLVCLSVAAFKFWLGPYLVERHLRRALSGLWTGLVSVQKAEVDLSGRVRVYGLELADQQGRCWFRVGLARLSLGGWPGWNPVLRRVELIAAEGNLHFDQGECLPPFRRPASADRRRLDCEDLAARGAVLRIARAGHPRPAVEYRDIDITLSRKAQSYELRVHRQGQRADQVFQVSATYEPDSKTARAEVVWRHEPDVAESSALLAAIGCRGLAAVQGSVDLSARFAGPLDDPAKCRHSWTLKVNRVRVDAPNGPIAEDASALVEAADGQGKILAASLSGPPGDVTIQEAVFSYTLERISLDVPEAMLTLTGGGGSSRFWEGLLRGVTLAGTARVTGSVDLDLTGRRPPAGSARALAGTVTADVPGEMPLRLEDMQWKDAVVTPRRVELTGLSGRLCGGRIGADLAIENWSDPNRRSFQLVLETLQVDLARLGRPTTATAPRAASGKMDLHLELAGESPGWEHLVGRGRVEVHEGNFWRTPVIADLFEQLQLPGKAATISDAQAVFSISGPLLHVRRAAIANPLAGIECTAGTVNLRTGQVDLSVVGGSFLTMNPLGRLLAGEVRKRLLARRVKGRWDALGPDSLTPVPIAQIADGSVELLVGLAREGGKFGAEMLKGFEAVFRSLPSAPASAPR